MKRLLTLILGISLSGLSVAEAVPGKMGAPCTKINSLTHVSGVTLICSTSGKKLLWKRSISVAKPTQNEVKGVASGPTGQTNLSPFSDFSQLTPRTKDISELAFQSSLKAEGSAGNDSAKIQVFTGPNSQNLSPKDFVAIHTVQKIFYGSNLPENIVLIFYSENDSVWGRQQMKELQPALEYQNSGGGPKTSVAGTALVDVSYGGLGDKNPYVLSGALEGHEFMHTVQQHQFIGQPYTWSMLPRWFVEGGGRFVENLIFSGLTESNYLKTAKNSELTGFNEKYFVDFLEATTVPTSGDAWGNSFNYSDAVVYGVGAKVHEILIALHGPNTLISFMADVARNGSFPKSFEKFYGISWAEAQPIVAKFIFDSTR
jgi:hypothetical protein